MKEDEVELAVKAAVELWVGHGDWNKLAQVLYRIDVDETVFDRARQMMSPSHSLVSKVSGPKMQDETAKIKDSDSYQSAINYLTVEILKRAYSKLES